MMSRFCLLRGGGHGHFDLGSPGQLGLKSVLHDGFDLSIVAGKVKFDVDSLLFDVKRVEHVQILQRLALLVFNLGEGQ